MTQISSKMIFYVTLISFYLLSIQIIFTTSENLKSNLNLSNTLNDLGLSFLIQHDKVKGLLSKEMQMAPKLIKNAGFPFEEHSVITKDGYILTLHRIPFGRKKYYTKGSPVLCVHGVFGTSTNFILRKPNQSLGFLLADAGHDVWLANTRGTHYSRKHKSIHNSRYWDFSFHEKGIYDLRAIIDYILELTGHKKLAYIGHSEGTTLLFVLTSLMPKYNEKISISFMMSPVVYLKGSRIPFLPLLIQFSDILEISSKILGEGEFLSSIFEIRKQEATVDHILILLFGLFFNVNLNTLDYKAFNIFLTNARGISVKELIHFTQLYKTGEFKLYDYYIENLEKYKSFRPPSYDLCSVTVPTILYFAQNDNIISYGDVKILDQHLYKSKLIKTDPNICHSDFIMGDNVIGTVYDNILKTLNSNNTLEFPIKEGRICNKKW